MVKRFVQGLGFVQVNGDEHTGFVYQAQLNKHVLGGAIAGAVAQQTCAGGDGGQVAVKHQLQGQRTKICANAFGIGVGFSLVNIEAELADRPQRIGEQKRAAQGR